MSKKCYIGIHPKVSYRFTGSDETHLAARELASLLHGVRNPPPLLLPGLCPLLSLWELMGGVKGSVVWLSGRVLTKPDSGKKQRTNISISIDIEKNIYIEINLFITEKCGTTPTKNFELPMRRKRVENRPWKT